MALATLESGIHYLLFARFPHKLVSLKVKYLYFIMLLKSFLANAVNLLWRQKMHCLSHSCKRRKNQHRPIFTPKKLAPKISSFSRDFPKNQQFFACLQQCLSTTVALAEQDTLSILTLVILLLILLLSKSTQPLICPLCL